MKSVWITLVLFVLASAMWGVWQVLRIEPLAPTSIEAPDRSPSDADGTASVPREDSESELAVGDPAGDARTEVAPAEEETSDAPPSSTLPSSALHGRVIDATTAEALPEFLLKIEDAAGRRVEVTSDAEGRFVVPGEIALGTVNVRPVDHRKRKHLAHRIPLQHTSSGDDVQLRVASGPTFRLAITPAGLAVTNLEARLRVNGTNVEGTGDFEPVREGTPMWVRFPPIVGDLLEARDIEVHSLDGRWSGSANVARIAGIEPRTIAVTLEPRAVLSGFVVDEADQPVPLAMVELKMDDVAEVSTRIGAYTKPDGAFRFEFLAPGTGKLQASAFRFAPETRRPVTLVAGEETKQKVVLVRLPPAGAIRGRVTSETGTYDTPSEVLLTSIENDERATPPQRAVVTWIETGKLRVGSFEFADLPAGKYRVAGKSSGSWYEIAPEWSPDAVLTSPPDATLAFLIRDSGARADLVFRVHDADTGAPIGDFRAWLEIDRRGGRGRDLHSDEVAIRGFAYDQKLRWRIDTPGYQPAIGDAASFGIEETRDGKLRRITEISLRRGWGELFLVTALDNRTPVVGAKIFLDDVEMATTDERGMALVLANARPNAIRIEYGDWRVRGRIDVQLATRRGNQMQNQVRMMPPRKKN